MLLVCGKEDEAYASKVWLWITILHAYSPVKVKDKLVHDAWWRAMDVPPPPCHHRVDFHARSWLPALLPSSINQCATVCHKPRVYFSRQLSPSHPSCCKRAAAMTTHSPRLPQLFFRLLSPCLRDEADLETLSARLGIASTANVSSWENNQGRSSRRAQII